MSGILSSPGILTGRGILSGTGILSGSGILTRAGGWVDPLKGIQFALRLQTHRGESDSMREGITVSGAGTTALNGQYHWNGSEYLNGKRVFRKVGTPYFIYWDSGYGPGWLICQAGVIYYFVVNDDDLPVSSGWQISDGDASAPVTTVFHHPVYQTFGLYQDVDCTVPATAAGQSVAAWSDELSGSGLTAIQSVSTKRFAAGYDGGIPVLVSDGIDDMMLSELDSSALDAAGFLVATFRPSSGYFYGTPVSGPFFGPAISSAEYYNQWGLAKPGAYTAPNPIGVSDSEWRTVVVSWSGTDFRQLVISPTLNVANSGTLPGAFASGTGVIGLAVHGTDTPYSYFQARYAAIGAGTDFLSAEDMERIATHFQSLAP